MFLNRARLSIEPLDDRIVPAKLSVADASIVEGNSGTQYAEVSVRLDSPSTRTVTVNYATVAGSATADSDYEAVAGTLSFARGQTAKTLSVPIHGDRDSEPNESFSVVLSGAKGASIRDGNGTVTIVDNEPRLSIGNAEGTVVYTADGGVYGTTLYFTVSLATAYDQVVTVNYTTADGMDSNVFSDPRPATAGVDYLAASGTLTFEPGETTRTIAVTVIGNDSGIDEWFSVELSGASGNAQIIDAQGIGTVHYYFEQPSYPGDGCDPDSPYYPNC